MKKSFNRRDFLKSSLQGLGTLTLLTSPLSIFASKTLPQTSNSFTGDPNLLYKQAKEYFYKKEYSSAIDIYHQLITYFPGKIQYYDGYAKVLGARQNSLEVTELYRSGLQKKPNNPHFKHRLSLSLRNLCTGNHKAELDFVSKYGQDNLMALSATLLLEAVATKPVKGYMMDLRDFPVILETTNKRLFSNDKPVIVVENSLIENINDVTSSININWIAARKSRHPLLVNEDEEVDKINNKTRRNLYTEEEKKSRKKEIKKAKKERWKSKLTKNIDLNRINLVDKYGLLILTDDIKDLDTIGKLRRYYRKQKSYDRIINLNRNIYTYDDSNINALALAFSLVKYSGSSSSLSEAKQLLDSVSPYAYTLPAPNTTTYYITLSNYFLKSSQPAKARNTLLDGLLLFDGRGGLSYAMMEKYAMSYLDNAPRKGIAVMKALCDKNHRELDEHIAPFVANYLNSISEKPLSIPEQIKSLTALAKLQKQAGVEGYSNTRAKIETLKAQLVTT
ncbi:MAG: tetratricopeptide repeat protein [Paludibacteraceae bacterium]